jgi:exopolysaccharide biosynthesis polyprenyl glycosylphosphotransferase
MNTSPRYEERMLSIAVQSPRAELLDAPSPSQSKNHRRIEWLINAAEMAGDLCAAVAALTSAYALYRFSHLGRQVTYSWIAILEIAGLFALICVWFLERSGSYRCDSSLLRVRETERVLRASSQTFLTAFCVALFTSYLVSRWVIVLAFLLVPLFLIVEKRVMVSITRALHAHGYGLRRVVIYGAGPTGRRIFSALSRSPKLGLEPVAFVDDDTSHTGRRIFEASYNRRRSAPVLAGPLDKIWFHRHAVDMLVVAIPSISNGKFSNVINEAAAAGTAISFVPYHLAPWNYGLSFVDLDGLVMTSFEPPASQDGYNAVKRAMDLFIGSVLLVLLAPFYLLISLIIRLTSPGPAIFAHERVGLNGKCFRMYKFRTMHSDAAPYAFCPQESVDPRITSFGQFLRRTSLDELPQLLNVIKGDMSLVGPRPEMRFIVEQYTSEQRQRLSVKPGITGLWQLSADRRFLIHENIEYDLYYIRNRNFFVDFAILLHTLMFAMRGI